MLAKAIVILTLSAASIGAAHAGECRLDHATYAEKVSGAQLQFRPKNPETDGAMTWALFDLTLPHVTEAYKGAIEWNSGSNSRPDGQIGRACTEDDGDETSCWLWTGNVYTIRDDGIGLIGDADAPASKGLLFADFGRSLYQARAFRLANPVAPAFDVFTLTGCKP